MAFGSLCSYAYSKFSASNDQEDLIRATKNSFKAEHSNLLNLTSQIALFTDKNNNQTAEAFKNIQSMFDQVQEVQNNYTTLLHDYYFGNMRLWLSLSRLTDILSRSIEVQYLTHIVDACNSNQFSHVLDAEKLYEDIQQYEFLHLKPANFSVVPFKMQQLYTMKLFKCAYNKRKNSIIISLNLPIRSRSVRNVKMVNYQSVPFLKNESICEFSSFPDTLFSWKEQDTFVYARLSTISPGVCSIDSPTCFIPEESIHILTQSPCLHSITFGSDLVSHSNACRMKCRPFTSTEPFVYKLDSANMVILNATEIEVNCPNYNHQFTVKEPLGTLGIMLSCECILKLNNKIIHLVGSALCHKAIPEFPLYSMLVPYLWTNLSNAFVKSVSFDKEIFSPVKYLDLHDILHNQLFPQPVRYTIPQLSLDAFEHLRTNHPFYSSILFVIWDGLLTLTVIMLWCSVMGNRGVAFMTLPQTRAMVLPNATVASVVDSTHVLMNYKYFNLFLVLLVVVDIFILVCVTTLMVSIILKCCTCHWPCRKRTSDSTVQFRKRLARHNDDTETLKSVPLYPTGLGRLAS